VKYLFLSSSMYLVDMSAFRRAEDKHFEMRQKKKERKKKRGSGPIHPGKHRSESEGEKETSHERLLVCLFSQGRSQCEIRRVH